MPEPLVLNTDAVTPTFNLGIMLGKKPVKGDVGLEIEVEGNKFPYPEGYKETHNPIKMQNYPEWSYVHDGSLRGEDNAEYVLTKPIDFKDVPKDVNKLFDELKKFGSVLDESDRTSIHVHLNCQDFYLNRLTTFVSLWFALEEVLTEFCGEHRVGNLFCLRAVDAPAIITYLKRFIKSDGASGLNEILHYSGLNTNALYKHGSIEIRTLQGCRDPQAIIDWVAILERLHTFSAEFKDPRDVPAIFSSGGPLSFFDKLLGDKATLVRKGVSWNDSDLAAAMFRGVRFAQELCYCRDWDEFKVIELKDDPFGRDSRKLAGKIVSSVPVNAESLMEYVEPEGYSEELEHELQQLQQMAGHTIPSYGVSPSDPGVVSPTTQWFNAQFVTSN